MNIREELDGVICGITVGVIFVALITLIAIVIYTASIASGAII